MALLSRASMGLAVRASREVAKLSSSDLASLSGLTASGISRTENGLRSLEVAEAIAVCKVLKITVSQLIDLAETYERSGTAAKRSKLENDLNELQQLAIQAAIEVQAA